jgi:hypothetical protein
VPQGAAETGSWVDTHHWYTPFRPAPRLPFAMNELVSINISQNH